MAPIICLFIFFFFFFWVLISSFFLLPPLLLFTSLFHLDFLPHYNICSLKNHSPKLLILILLIFLNIFLDHCVLGHFCYKPIFVKPISKLPFSLHYQWNHLPIGLPFSLLMRKKYHPSLKWNDEEGLLQDPKTHAPYSKMDFKVRFFFFFFF